MPILAMISTMSTNFCNLCNAYNVCNVYTVYNIYNIRFKFLASGLGVLSGCLQVLAWNFAILRLCGIEWVNVFSFLAPVFKVLA